MIENKIEFGNYSSRKEYLKEYCKKYYLAHKTDYKKRAKVHYQENKEYYISRAKNHYKLNAERHKLLSVLNRRATKMAKRLGLEKRIE